MKILPNILRPLCVLAMLLSPVRAADEKPAPDAAPLVEGKSLMILLPQPFQGWKTEPATCEEREIKGVKTMVAKASFTKPGEEADSAVTIQVADMARGKGKLAAMLEEWKEDLDPANYVPSPDGTQERLATVYGFPVHEELDRRQAYHEFNAIVADRFLVTLSAFSTRPEDAVAYLKAVNIKKLAELK